MGIDADLGLAFVKAYQAAGLKLPKTRPRVRLGQERRQARDRARGAHARTRSATSSSRPTARGARSRRNGIAVDARQQGPRGPPAHRRHDQEPRDRPGPEHALRQAAARRRQLDPRRGGDRRESRASRRAPASAPSCSALAAMHRGDYKVRSIQEHQREARAHGTGSSALSRASRRAALFPGTLSAYLARISAARACASNPSKPRKRRGILGHFGRIVVISSQARTRRNVNTDSPPRERDPRAVGIT